MSSMVCMLCYNWNENGSVGCNESGYSFSQEKGRAIYVAKEQTDPESLNVSLHVLWQAAKPSRAVDCRPWGLHLQRMCWPLPADHSGGPRGPPTGVQSPEQVRQRPVWCLPSDTRVGQFHAHSLRNPWDYHDWFGMISGGFSIGLQKMYDRWIHTYRYGRN
jgi:hypothetical protein